METIKAIALIRTSTSHQEIEAQKQEVLTYAESYGYSREEIKIIGSQGASAIKLDEAYLANMKQAYSTIENYPIECVFAWAVDRIGRDEVVLHEFKKFLIEHKIQLRIKSQNFQLFDELGNLNPSNEIIFSLYATFAKVEMETKKARFKRTKDMKRSLGKFIGGGIKYGFKKDVEGYVVKDEQTSEIVQLIFNLFSTGNYSTVSITDELEKVGITFKSAKSKIYKILTDIEYVTGTTEGYKYIPLISKETYDKCQAVLNINKRYKSKETQNNYFAIKILRCSECGYNYINSGKCYRCYGYRNKNTVDSNCNNNSSISVEIMDSLLWHIAEQYHIDYMIKNPDERETDITKSIEYISLKINTLQRKIDAVDDKLMKIAELYVDGIYSKEKKAEEIRKTKEAEKSNREQLNQYLQEKAALEDKQKNTADTEDERILKIIVQSADLLLREHSSKDLSYIIHKHIDAAYITKTNVDRKNIYKITINLKNGDKECFIYKPYSKESKLYTESGTPYIIDTVKHKPNGIVEITAANDPDKKDRINRALINQLKKLIK